MGPGRQTAVSYTHLPDIFGALGECACQDENPDHQHDILVGCADGILQHSLIQAQALDVYKRQTLISISIPWNLARGIMSFPE